MLTASGPVAEMAVKGAICFFTHVGVGCFAFSILALAIGGTSFALSPVHLVVGIVGVVEMLWYLLWFLPWKAWLQEKPRPRPTPLTKSQRKQLFNRVLNCTPDMESFVRKWFHNAHLDDIQRDNVKEWLAWVLFDAEEPSVTDNAELEDYVTEMEDAMDRVLKPGRGEAECMRPNFDPVRMEHRSLTYYTVVGLVDLVTASSLALRGFVHYRRPRSSFFHCFPLRPQTLFAWKASPAPAISYYFRAHTSTTHRPVLFVHGMGIGLFHHLAFLRRLPRDVGVIAVELLPLSSRITTALPPIDELSDALVQILNNHAQQVAWTDLLYVATSIGTLTAAPLLCRADVAPRIARVVLVDPVAMLLHLPDAHRALGAGRGPPRNVAERVVHFLAAAEPGTSHVMARRFWWREVALWRDVLTSGNTGGDRDLEAGSLADQTRAPLSPFSGARKTTIAVASKDCVIDSRAIASYVYFGDTSYDAGDVDEWKTTAANWAGQSEVELLWMDGCEHGQVWSRTSHLKALERVVEVYGQKDAGRLGMTKLM